MNSAQIVGAIGTIEIKDNVTRLSVATHEKDSTTGEQITHWHNCVVFKTTKEFVDKYFKKGDWIALTGEIVYHKHKDVKYTTIKCFRAGFAGSKQKDEEIPDY